jgi:hypothetical protein
MTTKPPETVVELIELAHRLAVEASGRPAPDAVPPALTIRLREQSNGYHRK